MGANELHRDLEAAKTRSLVGDPFQSTFGVADPAPAIIARAKIGAEAETFRLRQQLKLHVEVAAELHKGCTAASQELDHGEQGIEFQRGIESGKVTRIACHDPALLGDTDLQKRLAEIERPPDIADKAV